MARFTFDDLSRLIAAADALGAPYFGLDLIRDAVVVRDAQIRASEQPSGDWFANQSRDAATGAVDDILTAGARAAWGLIAQRHMPLYVADELRGDGLADGIGKRANDEIIAASLAARKLLGR